MSLVEVNNVVKRFDGYAAVNHVSFDIGQGTIFGLLGPNGAGKTTMIRMLTNIFYADEGSIKVFSENVGPSNQNNIGYLPEERGLYKKLKVIDQLIYFAMLKGMSRKDASAKAKTWLKKMDASEWETKKIQELSKGMQQKVQFISTILHDPELLILDEPFSGFDPINTELLKRIVLDMKAAGKTIILSTHIMEQVEQLCDDICLINKGQIILSGKVRDIKRNYGRDTILMEFEGDDGFINNFTNLKFINKSNNRLEFRINSKETSPEAILKAAIESNVKIFRFEYAEPSLNEIFIDVVSGERTKNE